MNLHRLALIGKLLVLALLGALWILARPAEVLAQNPDPGQAVLSELVGDGYDVIGVGNFPDAQGNPQADSVYAQMETITADFDSRYIVEQAVQGFDVLNRFFPGAKSLIVVLHYVHYLYFFQTNPQDWDDYNQERVTSRAFWDGVRDGARVYDITAGKYISRKDFIEKSQVEKNQTDKDFSGLPKNPIPPADTNPSAKPENILLEPATTYLPADGKSEGFLLASLSDHDYAALPGRDVAFTYEAQGQEEINLGHAVTDAFGTARAKVVSSQEWNDVLLRANTTTLNADAQIYVGAPPGNDFKAQAAAVIKGLESQGYQDAGAEYDENTGPAGQSFRAGVASVRVNSKSFDRAVYSQLSRMIGTLRMVMPQANFLRPILIYAKGGRDYYLLYQVSTDLWDAYIKGQIGENQFWQSIEYDGAVDENGNPVGSKDFVDKDFGASDSQPVTNAPRTVESTVTKEEWGDQLTLGSFLVAIGGSADNFTVGELSGNTSGFTIYATPDFNTPIFRYTVGDERSELTALRLEQGQYVLEIEAANAPAKVQLKYVEHLVR